MRLGSGILSGSRPRSCEQHRHVADQGREGKDQQCGTEAPSVGNEDVGGDRVREEPPECVVQRDDDQRTDSQDRRREDQRGDKNSRTERRRRGS